MHTHIGAVAILTAFGGVLLAGTLWRLLAAHFAASDSDLWTKVGKAMAFQY